MTSIKLPIVTSTQILKYILFIIFLVIGINSFGDFGLYGDEPIHRWIGSIYYLHIKEVIFNFNFHNEYLNQINNLYKDEYLKLWVQYPIFFDLLTEFLADIFNIQSSKGIFELRHITNFIIFYISLIYLFKLLKKRFSSDFFSLLGVILVFLSPRIFSESFYNSKDILFLSFSIINLYYSFKFINSQNKRNLIFYSISAGLLINSRIMGLFFPLLTFSIIIFDVLENKKYLLEKLKKVITSFFIIIFVVFLFWPFMWTGTIDKLTFYINFIQQNLGVFTNTYFGETILSTQAPWHFRFIWISISISIFVLFFSLLGFAKIFYKFIKNISNLDITNKIWLDKMERFDLFILILFLFPLLSIFKFTNSFDGWRHYYYIYPLLIYFSIFFLNELKVFNYNLFKFFVFLIIINITLTGNWMFQYHPYQYTYFNFIKTNLIKKNFNVDYMGLSLNHALKYILNNDSKEKIFVSSLGETSVEGSSLILDNTQQNRLKFVNYKDADYVIDTFRPKAGNKIFIDTNIFYKYYELIVDENIVYRIYKKI